MMRLSRITFGIPLLLIFVVCCRKDNSSFNSGKDEVQAEHYFKGNLNGTAFNWQEKEETQWRTATSASSSVLYGEGSGSLAAVIEKAQSHPSMERKPSLRVRFQTFTIVESNVSAVVFNSFMRTGSWAYSTTAERVANTKNIILEYKDDQGNDYNSVGTQTGSAFNVIAVTPIPATFGSQETVKIKISLNCKLYPEEGNGAALNLTNGEAVLYVENLLNHH